MPTVWEAAKEKLFVEITEEGRIPDEWIPKEIQKLDPVYEKANETNFATNLRALRKGIKKFSIAAKIDAEALQHDRKIHSV
jgi:hypothetical protein